MDEKAVGVGREGDKSVDEVLVGPVGAAIYGCSVAIVIVVAAVASHLECDVPGGEEEVNSLLVVLRKAMVSDVVSDDNHGVVVGVDCVTERVCVVNFTGYGDALACVLS